MFRKTVAGVTALLLALGMVAFATAPAQAGNTKGPQHNGDKVVICHSPSSATNPWTRNEVSVNALKGEGHYDPSSNDTHDDDIIPAYDYDVHDDGPNWHTETFHGLNLDKVFEGGVTGQQIVDAGCRIPVTPGYIPAPETCVADSRVPGSITVLLHDAVVYTLYGPGNVVIPLVNGASGPLLTSVSYRLVAADANDKDKYKVLGFDIVFSIPPYAGECGVPVEPEAVEPAFDAVVQELCIDDELTPGSITVDVTRLGVKYTITKDGNEVLFHPVSGETGALEPGTYLVEGVDADPNDGYVVENPLSEEVLISGYDGDCGPTVVVPDYRAEVQETCVDGKLVGGWISVDLTRKGVVYTITKNGTPVAFDGKTGETALLQPGEYLVEGTDADPTDEYEVTEFSETVTILPYGDDCGEVVEPVKVTPAYAVDAQECVEGSFVGGFITVDVKVPGVVYTITKNGAPVAFDAKTGTTTDLAPGPGYIVKAVDADPSDLYEATPFTQPVTIGEDESGLCDQVTLAGVIPTAKYTEPTCAAPTGSFVLFNDTTLPGDAEPAVFWTVGGNARAEGVAHSAAAGSTVTIVATANGPEYGFDGDLDGVLQFTHKFADAPACGDLDTLALTGGQPVSPTVAIAGLLGLLGVAMLRLARRNPDLREEV